MNVLVTGGAGYLGRAVTARLLDRGDRVRALVRNASPRPPLDPRVEIVRGDVTDRAAIRAAMPGVDAVFHMAACVKTWMRDRAVFDRVNVASLDTIVEEASAAGVARVLYTSSFMALGPTDGGVADETTRHPGGRFRNDYERTKALGLARARALIAGGAPLSVLIPGVIFGPGALTDGNHIAAIARSFLDRKLPGIPGSGRKLWTYSYVDDVAEGHLLALDRGPAGEIYILGGEDCDLAGLLALLEEISGVPAPRLHVPIALLALVGACEVALAYAVGRTPELTPGVAAIYDHDWRLSSEKARKGIGYRITPLRDAMERTIRWLRQTPAAKETA